MFIDLSLEFHCICSICAPTHTPPHDRDKEGRETRYHLLVERLRSERVAHLSLKASSMTSSSFVTLRSDPPH